MHYNTACVFCTMSEKAEAMAALARAWKAGFPDTGWVRRDPDLALLHDQPSSSGCTSRTVEAGQ